MPRPSDGSTEAPGRRRLGRPVALLAGAGAAVMIAACGSAVATKAGPDPGPSSGGQHRTTAAKTPTRRHVKPAGPAYARLLHSAQSSAPSGFVPVARWRGATAAWIARTPSGIALLSFDQQLLALNLHSGTVDAGAAGWRWGPLVGGSERRHVVSAFNGGFKFDTGAGGFESRGRVGSPLRAGLGSIVTYSNGYSDIGSWHRELPAAGRKVTSVRQNLTLLVDHGRPAAGAACVSCWGATLGGVADPARSALGITADGRLIWAGGEHLTPDQLANVLLGARVVRAVELDINPEWVAAYLYGHRSGAGPLAPIPIVPGQPGVPGQFLTPYARDFFSVVTR